MVDELISNLNSRNEYGGTIAAEVEISALAFADDIVLLEDEENRVPITISTTKRFLEARGMQINPKKCYAINAIRVGGTTICRTKPTFSIDNKPITVIHDLNAFKYFGHQAGGTGLLRPTILNVPM